MYDPHIPNNGSRLNRRAAQTHCLHPKTRRQAQSNFCRLHDSPVGSSRWLGAAAPLSL
jgi:hypothetical protein